MTVKLEEEIVGRKSLDQARREYTRLYNYWVSLVNNIPKPEGNDLDVVKFKEAMDQGRFHDNVNTRRLSLQAFIMKDVYLKGKDLGYESVDGIPEEYEKLVNKCIKFFIGRLGISSRYRNFLVMSAPIEDPKILRYKFYANKKKISRYEAAIKAYNQLKEDIPNGVKK